MSWHGGRRAWTWAPLGLLLAATVVSAAAFDRASWPGLVGDEATYLMQAESLVWDFDLRYEKDDYDRFREHWQRQPEGLILQSSDGGQSFAYGKPLFYSAAIAPFLRISPTRGAPLANALLLALAAIAGAVTLERRLGSLAPLLVAVLVFASITFAHVFWAHADLFLFCLTVLAFALAYGGRQHRVEMTEIYEDAHTVGRGPFLGRWALVGMLLGIVILSRPFYLPLLLPAALAVPRRRRASGLAALGAGVALFLGAAVLVNLAVRDTWSSYGGQRQGFYSYTGYPEVDLPAGAWEQGQEQKGASWVRPQTLQPGFDAHQTLWNEAYFLAGRHVGILPYFLPLVLCIFALRGGEGRQALVVAALAASALFLLVKPFNFYGGGDSLANRYFLPLYGALWFAAARPLNKAWLVVVVVAAGPFLYPLWANPWGYPRDTEGGYRYVSELASRWLPYETTQSHLKPSGGEDVRHGGLWVKPLSTSVEPDPEGRFLRLTGTSGSLLIGHSRPLEELRLTVLPVAPKTFEVKGAEVGETVYMPNGRGMQQLFLGKPRAVHRMWWTNEPVYLYELGFRISSEISGETGGDPQPTATFRIQPGGR